MIKGLTGWMMIFLFCSCSIGMHCYSQSVIPEVNRSALLQQAAEASSRWSMNKQKAEAWALVTGRPIRIELDKEGFMELQAIDESGTPRYYVTHNVTAATSIGAGHLHPGGRSGFSLTGNGLTALLWDAGKPLASHVELAGRVIAGDGASYLQLHSTHVAATMVGSGVRHAAKGMAPGAQLKYFDWNNDLAEMSMEAANGGLVSNHSYGYIRGWASVNNNWMWFGNPAISTTEDYLFGFYDYETRFLDQIAYNNPYYLIFRSAGNDRGEGPGTTPPNDGPHDCIGSDAIGKNVMTVGAVNDLPMGYQGSSSVSITPYSSWGPADDGRIKPDVCANGASLYSASSAGTNAYTILSGTSMSAPSAAGAALLLQEFYHQKHGQYMRSATLKALIIHTADEAGPSPGPDYMFGWGLMNLESAAMKIQESISCSSIDESLLLQGGNHTRQIRNSGKTPIKVSIAWTDPPGTPPAPVLDPITPMLINDLDIIIIDQHGQSYYPWRLDPANPSSAASQNAKNYVDNVEQVFILDPEPGLYTIVINHAGTLTGGSQAFSLIIDGEDVFVDPPQVFQLITDTSLSPHASRLSWTADTNQNVLIAWNTLPFFGQPIDGMSYGVGDPIPQGGIILYQGNDSSLRLTQEQHPGSPCYFAIWSLDSSRRYSYLLLLNNTAPNSYPPPLNLQVQMIACGEAQLIWDPPAMVKQATGLPSSPSPIDGIFEQYDAPGKSLKDSLQMLSRYIVYRDGQPYDSLPPIQTSLVDAHVGSQIRTYHVVAMYEGLALAYSSSNQVQLNPGAFSHNQTEVLIEGFENVQGSLPPGWSSHSAISSNQWKLTSSRVKTGTQGIVFEHTTANNNAWLISPPIDLRNVSAATLKYFENIDRSFTALDQAHRVKVSASYLPGQHPSLSAWSVLRQFMGAEDTWVQAEIDLSAFAGQIIHLAYHYTGYNATNWYLDDIQLSVHLRCEKRWHGTTDSNWSNPMNWSDNTLPSLTDAVFVPANCPFYPSWNSDTLSEIRQLDIESGGRLILQPHQQLTVIHSITNRGEIYLKANAQQTATLLYGDHRGSSGAFHIDYYLASGQQHLITSLTSPIYASHLPASGFFTYDEPSGTWNSLNPSAQNPTQPGIGFMKQSTLPLGANIITWTGLPTSGRVQLDNLSRTPGGSDSMAGFNLIGNPYPSYLNWESSQGISTAHIDRAIYTWLPEENEGSGQYAYYVDGISVPKGKVSSWIRPGQAFFVRVSDNEYAGEVSMDQHARGHAGNIAPSSPVPGDIVRVTLNQNAFTDETVIRFLTGAGTAYDPQRDALKRFPLQVNCPLVYSLRPDNQPMSIYTLPALDQAVSIPFHLESTTADSATLSFDGLAFADATWSVLLEDQTIDSMHDLRLASTYTFNHLPSSQGRRFIIHFQARVFSGKVHYANFNQTPMRNIPLVLQQNGISVSDTVLTDAAGVFSFHGPANGAYQIKGKGIHPWGGVNAADAMMVAQHFVQLITLDSFAVKAGDVDGNGALNTSDALLIQQRYVGIVNSFPVGDWLLASRWLQVPGSGTQNLDIPALCYGDVNTSYVVPNKQAPALEADGTLTPLSKWIQIPIRVRDKVSLGSISLSIGLSIPGYEVAGVDFPTHGEPVWNIIGDDIRVAWFTLEPWTILPGETLMYIFLQATTQTAASGRIHIRIGDDSEFADIHGNIIEDLTLLAPGWISASGQPMLQVYPNPVTGSQSMLDIQVGESSRLKLSLLEGSGREVRHYSHYLEAGIHSIPLNIIGLRKGVYYLHILLENQEGRWGVHRKLVIY